MSALQRLLAGAVLNPEVGIAALPTLPFITFSVSVTPERESEDQTDSIAGANLRTITAPPRFVISSYSSHHSGANIAKAEVDSFVRPSIPLMTVATTVTSTVDPATTVKEKFVETSVLEVILLVVGLTTPPDVDLQKVYVPQWSVTNGSRLDDGRTYRDTVDEFAPPNAEVRMHAEYNIRERRRLNSVVEEKSSLLKARDAKIEDEVRVLNDCNTTLEKEKSELNVKVVDRAASVKVREQEAADLDAMVTSIKSQNDNLIDQVHKLENSSVGLQDKVAAYENFIDQLKKFQDEKMAVVNEKFDKLCVNFVEMALHLEEKFYPHLLTTISGRRWLLTHGIKRVVAKCLNSTEYLSVLGAAIGKAEAKSESGCGVASLSLKS
ncbi:hypothetical protein Tco_0053993 [Tanacetum coccineum]